MAHKPFNLYKRPTTKKNNFMYYVQFYSDDGQLMTARSTGETGKAAAETWAYEQTDLIDPDIPFHGVEVVPLTSPSGGSRRSTTSLTRLIGIQRRS